MRLRTKLGLILSAGAVVLASGFYLYTSHLQRGLFVEGFESNSQKIFETVKLGLEVGLSEENFKAISTVFDWAKSKPGVEWIALTDSSDQVFAQFPEDLKVKPEEMRQRAAAPSVDEALYVRGGDWRTPLAFGKLYIAFSTGELREHERYVLRDSAITAVVLLSVVLLVAAVVSLGVTLPLERLQAATVRITGGHLEARVDESRAGSLELKSVASSFNAMVEQLVQTQRRLQTEQEKSEGLLLNILPAPIAERLKKGERTIADSFECVSVIFADLVGFTPLSATLTPVELVRGLSHIFLAFDELAEKHGVEKIKTIGDSYMAVSGLPFPRADHATAAVKMAIEMQQALVRINAEEKTELRIRIGIHSGPVAAGVIGSKKFSYDLWGDTVNSASRMESHGAPDRVHISEATYLLVKDQFEFEDRGIIQVKGKGPMRSFFVNA